MSNQITSAAPFALLNGIQDNSAATPAVTPQSIPTHLPKVFTYAQKGRPGPQLVGEGAVQMFGADTFDLRKPFATHQTVLADVLQAAGNAQMIERMMPADAPIKANFTLWLDIKPALLPNFLRNADGTYELDPISGDPMPGTGTTAGFLAKWVVTTVNVGLASDADSTHFGNKVSKPGSIVDTSVPGTPSTMYPIMDFWADSFGSYFNNAGFRIWAPTVNDENPVASTVLNAMQAYPFRMTAIRRATPTSTAKLVPTVSGDYTFDFVLQPNAVNPYTTAVMSLDKVLPKQYSLTNVKGFDPIYADLSGFHLYSGNIATLLGEIYTAELAALPAGTDFNVARTDQMWLTNLVSAQSSNGSPYAALRMVNTDANAVALTESTNMWAASGGDGTMSEALLAGLVADRLADYSDASNSLQNTLVNVESIMYDTGWPLATKQALCNFISLRKDTFVVLSTYDVNGPALSASDEDSIAIALRTQLQLFPESTYFGTPVCRGLVMGRYGDLLGYEYDKKLPITIELAAKSAAFMGAGTGVWDLTKLFDKLPNAELTMFANLNSTWSPASQVQNDWANGLNYPLSASRDTVSFPALKTAYGDDTSVLTSFFTAMACVELEKIGVQIWVEFRGSISLTEAQLVDKVQKRVQELASSGKFAGLFKIVPVCTITASDELRGYSWTLAIKIYANSMKSVMTLNVQAYRMTSLPANS